jgi:hypothetical protein
MRSVAGSRSDAVNNGASFVFDVLPAWHFDSSWASTATHCNQSEVQRHHGGTCARIAMSFLHQCIRSQPAQSARFQTFGHTVYICSASTNDIADVN